MNIAIVIPNLRRGGAERVVTRLAAHWAGRHEVTMILFERAIEYECNARIISLDLPASRGPLAKILNIPRRAWKLRSLLRELRPDRTIAFLESANMPAVLGGWPVTVTVRNDPRVLFHPLERKLQGWLYRRSNVRRVVCNSLRMAEAMQIEYKLQRADVIYNPVDPLELEGLARADTPDVPGPYIVAAGRLTAQKNFPLLIRAFARSRAARKYRLVILGDGAERTALEALARKEGVAERLHLPGAVNNPFAYFRGAECFVLSSNHEGFPNVLLEALACGTPALASDCDFGPVEVITPGVNGHLFQPGDEDALVALLDRAAREDDFFEKLRPGCLPSLKPFRLEQVAPRWLEDPEDSMQVERAGVNASESEVGA